MKHIIVTGNLIQANIVLSDKKSIGFCKMIAKHYKYLVLRYVGERKCYCRNVSTSKNEYFKEPSDTHKYHMKVKIISL